jgi:prepilin-type N-terminal cleavage/methylation domain-containing protein
MVKNRKGFTLIELMIVVAIIGVLAAIAIPAYNGYIKKSRMTELANSMGAVGNAALEYYQSHADTWPQNMTSAAMISDSLGITVPNTYVSNTNVTWSQANHAVTVAGIANIGSGPDTHSLTLTVAPHTRGVWTSADNLPQTYMPKE